ncbi:hypothetical protein ACLB2K_058433 [Fragaria x ananassa]
MRKKKNEQVGFVRFSRRTDVSSSSVLFSFALPFSSINSRSQGAGFAAVMMMSLGLFKIDDLPGQVVIEILCRLPLRSAFQCKCVSKDSTYLSITIYFPEVGEWREFDVPLPQMGRLYSYNKHAGIAYCGKLYWLVQGFIVELDALALDISTSSEDVAAKYCCFIEIVLDKQFDRRIMCLGLCRGSMRAMSIDSDHIRDGDHIRSWELRLGDDDDHHHHEQWGKWRFVHRASASLLISEKITSTYNGYVEVDNASENVLLCLDSLDEDTVYMLRKNGEVCRYNVLTGECDYISLGGPYSMFGVRMDPITHPWWPTPLPRVSSPRPFAF